MPRIKGTIVEDVGFVLTHIDGEEIKVGSGEITWEEEADDDASKGGCTCEPTVDR